MNSKIVSAVITLLVIMVIYVFLSPKLQEGYANPFVNNGVVADVVFKYNTDLDYAAARWDLQISPEENRRTGQLAPIQNPAYSRPWPNLWGSAPAAQETTRIPDKYSNIYFYNHPIIGTGMNQVVS